jgi:hypothetical protein
MAFEKTDVAHQEDTINNDKTIPTSHVEDQDQDQNHGQRASAEGTVVGDHTHHPGKTFTSDGLDRRQSHKVDLISNTNARLANPLGDLSDEECMTKAAEFAKTHNLPVEAFTKGGLLAKRPSKFEFMTQLTESDKEKLRAEVEHPYRQPKILYQLVIACSVAAAVQGMDESVISGAQVSQKTPMIEQS